MENMFNLVDEPWIPVASRGLVSLTDIFSDPTLPTIGGNPVQKIAVMKLLFAISQTAFTPNDEDEWRHKGANDLATECLNYLKNYHRKFYLFGDNPFLQMPAIQSAKKKNYGALLPEVSTGNTTILSHIQTSNSFKNSDKALLLITLMSMSLGGKKTDNSINLTPGYEKSKSAKPGPGVSFKGLLHSFPECDTLQGSIWLNTFSHEQIDNSGLYPGGLGKAPWEKMPIGEACSVAQKLKETLIGRLIPLSRFCLLALNDLHYSEGILHPTYKDGAFDPTVAANTAGKEIKVMWVNPDKRPWRELTGLLSFLGRGYGSSFQSLQLRVGVERARSLGANFSIWSGGLRVSFNAGEQYVTGTDDYVESRIFFDSNALGEIWFAQLKIEMEGLDQLARVLFGAILKYNQEQMSDGGGKATSGVNRFWLLCEAHFQHLVDACVQRDDAAGDRKGLRESFAAINQQIYNESCPNLTARQLDAWAKYRPNNYSYLSSGGER